MPATPDSPSAHIELIAATPDQEPILANLLELYAYDFSKFHNLELGPDGRFGYRPLPLYWREPGRHPFLVKLDGRLAGLVLAREARKSRAITLSGIWRSSLSFAGTEGLELERT